MRSLDEVQQEAHDAVFAEFEAGVDQTYLQAVTGFGKTRVASMIVRSFQQRTGKPSLFLVNRKDLATQAEESFIDRGLICGVEMAERYAPRDGGIFGGLDVVVGSKDTMQGERLQRWSPNTFASIISDECDLSLAKSYDAIFRHFRDYKLLGLTATTQRLDGVPLIPTLFESRAFHYPLKDYPDGRPGAVTNGHVARPIGHVMPLEIDIRGLKVRNGDFAPGEFETKLAPHVNAIANAVVKEMAQFGLTKVMVFTPNVKMAILLAEAINGVGGGTLRAAAAHGNTREFPMNDRQRTEIVNSYKDGTIHVLCNCELYTRGFDVPETQAVFIARATKSIALFFQIVGRSIRRAVGKTEAHVFGFGWTSDDDDSLVSTVDLFLDDEDDPRTREIARGLARNSADYDPEQVCSAAKKERQREREDEVRKEQKRLKLLARKKDQGYERIDFDPLGLPPSVIPEWTELQSEITNPMTDGQRRMFDAYGVRVLAGLSYERAESILNGLLQRDLHKMASPAQIRRLISPSFGYTPQEAEKLTMKQAKSILGSQFSDWRKKRKGGG